MYIYIAWSFYKFHNPDMVKKKKVRKSKIKLPKRIIPIKNKDKDYHEEWTDDRDPLNFPHPFRVILVGRPNCGKSTAVKNIVMRSDPPFTRVLIIHCDAKETEEYDDLEPTLLTNELIKLTDPQLNKKHGKTLLILEDLDYSAMNKHHLALIDRYFGYASTHKNISLLLCAQDLFAIPSKVRRMSNVWVLWKSRDKFYENTLSSRTNIDKDRFQELMNMLKDTHDSLWIDLTAKSPYPIRLNGYTMIEFNKKKDPENETETE